MALKAIIASLLAAGTAFVASVGGGASSSSDRGLCEPRTAAPVIGLAAAMQQGVPVARQGVLAIAGGSVIAASPAASAAQGAVRHVSSDPHFGIVYVRDLPGGDDIVAQTPAGGIRLHRPAEVSHPSWTPGGDIVWGEGARLKFWSHVSGRVSSTSAAVRGGLVFSPIALGDHRVVAAVTEPLGGVPTEDEQLSNLWRYDSEQGWRRMTRFRASADHWSVIRTPQLGPTGIEFIRVHGTASATRQPVFQRWSLRRGRARMEATLPSERYLAGYQDGARLWNLPSQHPTTWILARESADGTLRELGCGAVAVDPVDVPDPDRTAKVGASQPSSDYPIPPPSPQPPAHEVAVLVGDYAGENGAQNAAHDITVAYGADAQVKVISSDDAPTALKPGSWGAIMWIGAQADPVASIKRFWDKLPQYADRSWVVAP